MNLVTDGITLLQTLPQNSAPFGDVPFDQYTVLLAEGQPLPPRTCAIGSVKTNVGHLAAASGATALIKTVMMLRHGKLPPSLNFDRPNPEIDFESTPFYVNTELRPWELPGQGRESSFPKEGFDQPLVQRLINSS